MLNIENINRVIEKIRTEADHFKMSAWAQNSNVDDGWSDPTHIDLSKPMNCGTAACIGGWAASLAHQDYKLGKTIHLLTMREFFGYTNSYIEHDELPNLFHMDYKYYIGEFDRYPAEIRAKAGIRALEILRDTGKSDWGEALRSVSPDMEKELRRL